MSRLVVGALAVALGARISLRIPVAAVPVTGQTVAVLLVGGWLGPGRGAMALLLYLGAGAVGMPVFAGGAGGRQVLCSPSGGYLLSFPPTAFLAGMLIQRGWGRQFAPALLAMTLCHSLTLAIGAVWLYARDQCSHQCEQSSDALLATAPIGVGGRVGAALYRGVVPLLPGAVFKSILAAVLMVALKHTHRINPQQASAWIRCSRAI